MAAPFTLQVTVDATAGPGEALADVVLSNLRSFKVDVPSHMLELTDNNGKVTNLSIDAAATFVVTITGGNYVVDIDNA